MMASGPIHTVPTNGHWGHRVEGEHNFLPEVYATREEAEAIGRGLAIAARTEHVVHHRDGSIAYRQSYHDEHASSSV